MEQIDMANMSAWEFISSDIMLGFKYEDCTPAHNVKKSQKTSRFSEGDGHQRFC